MRVEQLDEPAGRHVLRFAGDAAEGSLCASAEVGSVPVYAWSASPYTAYCNVW